MIYPLPLAQSMVIVMLSAAFLCFIVSEITENYSQVDKLWSLMPIVYSIMALSYSPSPRLWIMTGLVTAWGLRLSYNFSRKGGYNIIPWKGEEDYRWQIMRDNTFLKGRFRFGLFNLFFISLYQHFLILLFSTPLLLAAGNPETDINYLDLISTGLVLLFLTIETIADNQQYLFHQIKKGKSESNGKFANSLKNGFLSEGLFSYSRHPNFASEQAIWICFYFFGVAASGDWINWTASGAILLVLLFQGSSVLTEKISSSKYPAYREYQEKVSRFFPPRILK